LGEGGGGESMLLTFAHTRRTWPWGGGESDSGRRACASVRAPGPNDRLSVGGQPRPPAPSTVYASSVRHATVKSSPIARTVPSQVHPAAQRRLSPTALALPRRRRPRFSPLVRSLLLVPPTRALHQRRGGLGVSPRGRTHPQAPILFPRPRGHVPVLQVTPQ